MANDRHSVGSCKNPDLQTFATGGESSPLLPEALHFGVVVVVVRARGDERAHSRAGRSSTGACGERDTWTLMFIAESRWSSTRCQAPRRSAELSIDPRMKLDALVGTLCATIVCRQRAKQAMGRLLLPRWAA